MSRIVSIDPAVPSVVAIGAAVGILRAGGLVAFPTETVYGLGGRALDPVAIARIFAAKGRPTHHPLIAHILGAEDASALCAKWPSVADTLAAHFWPGPLTLVVERASRLSPDISGGSSTIALRAPSHPVARALIAELGEPIAAPSANRYQSISPTLAEHVVKSLGDNVDMILDGGPCARGIESTVVDLTGEVPRILRPGAISISAIRSVIDVVAVTKAVADDSMRASPGMDVRHYAPKARLRVVEGRTAVADVCREAAKAASVAVIWRGAAAPLSEASYVVELADDAELYARDLFATLHDLDARGVDVVIVESPPSDDSWWAVRDRLMRAQA